MIKSNQATHSLSIVFPCLNESEGLLHCLQKCKQVISEHNYDAEIIVVDNGSTDNSANIAEKNGAILIKEPRRGYGRALKTGLDHASKKYLVFLDADDSYDINELPKYVEQIKNGRSFVTGNRFTSSMHPDSMPWLHRHIGNPLLTLVFNILNRNKVLDVYCGYRLISKELYQKLQLVEDGWEFALEMLIQISRENIKFVEVPISYVPRKGKSKMTTISTGIRSLIYILKKSTV